MVQPEKKGLSQDAWSVRGSREGEEVISSVWLEQVGLGDEVTFAPETSTPPPQVPHLRSLPVFLPGPIQRAVSWEGRRWDRRSD